MRKFLFIELSNTGSGVHPAPSEQNVFSTLAMKVYRRSGVTVRFIRNISTGWKFTGGVEVDFDSYLASAMDGSYVASLTHCMPYSHGKTMQYPASNMQMGRPRSWSIHLERSMHVSKCTDTSDISSSSTGTKLPLVFESYGLLNDIFPFPSIMEAGYPISKLHLTNVLFDIIIPSVLASSL